jgi:hypothetical protein
MPYIIKTSKDGFKVCKKSKTDECFSKEPIPLERAKKQRVAIIISENKKEYLDKAKEFAKKAGYDDWNELKLAEKPYKLELNSVKFGRVGYSDYLQNLLTNSPDAETKRKSYLARATKIKGDWKDNKYSPNNLAIKILWGGGKNTDSLEGGDLTQEITNAFLYGIAYPIFNPSKENVFNFQPNALLPGPKDMLDMTIQSYKDPAQNIGKYELVLDNPTFKFYVYESVLIIAVRGTQEFRDVRAWLPIARGDVIETDRVSTDLRDIQTSLLNYKEYKVFGTGHSLAGVILDKLLDKKLILQAVSFNPAVEKVDLLNTENLRYYLEQDPLFNIMGHFANNTIVLDRPQNIWVRLLKIITPSTASINPATDHFIDKFKPHMPDNYGLVGGAIPLNKELYEKAKELVYPLYDKPSAFRSGAVIKKYKELGGEFKDDGERPLERWFKEEWKDIADKEYPVFRPTKRVSEDTTLTPEEIDPKNLKEQIELKQEIKGEQNLPAFKAKGGAIKLEADIAAKGGEKVDETVKDKLEEIVTEPMDGGDIAHYYPKVRIIKYNDLDNYTSIEEILPADDTYFILLYLDSPSTGHWVAMTRNKNLITFFDSYGGKIDSQLKWVDMGERIRLDTDKPCLTRLLKAGNVPYNYSPYDYQSNNPDIATCGSHVLNFITCTLDKGMSVNDYRTHMERIRERTGLDYDEIVSMNFPVR